MNSDSPSPPIQRTILSQIRHRIQSSTHKWGVSTQNQLRAAGFAYTGDGDAARCHDCGLEVSGWTHDMVPFTIHSQRSPRCRFVNLTATPLPSPSTVVPDTTHSIPNVRETTPVRNIGASGNSDHSSSSFVESIQLKRVRMRSLSHWPHEIKPSATQMFDAGFFGCNVQDRTACIYCNLLCQNWTADTDDPREVHRRLSPNCFYVVNSLPQRAPLPVINANGRLPLLGAEEPPLTSNNFNTLSVSRFVRPVRQGNWSQNNQGESIDNVIQATYFDTDVKSAVTCRGCRKSFRHLDANENPMIDHARRFPHCPFVQSFQGIAAYRIQQGMIIEHK